MILLVASQANRLCEDAPVNAVRRLLGLTVLVAALSSTGTASADLVVSPEVSKAACPGGRFHAYPNHRLSHPYADEAATCTVFSDEGITHTVDVDFLTFSTERAMIAQANELPTYNKAPVFAYAVAGNAQGDAYSLVYASAMLPTPAPAARATGRKLMTRLEPFGFKVYYF